MRGTQVCSLMTKFLRNAALFLLLVAGGGGAAQVLAQSKDQQEPAPAQDEPDTTGIQPLTLTEQVIRDVLEPLQRGIEEHSAAQVLTLFDQQETPDYAQLRDQ